MNKKSKTLFTFRETTMSRSHTSELKLVLRIAVLIVLFSSCDQSFNLLDSLNGPEITSLSVEDSDSLSLNPLSMGLYIGSNGSFAASGGLPPYTFSLVSGSGSINSSGVYTAPITAGTGTIEVLDDNGDAQLATITILDVLTNVDYEVSSVIDTSSTNIGGDPLTGSFTLTNIDVSNGTKTIEWDVYLSNDTNFSADDDLIDTGNSAALASLDFSVVNFTGFWPLTAGPYYFIVKTYAVDDITDTVNNVDNSGVLAISGAPAPDVNYQIGTVPAGSSTALTLSAISETFTIDNIGLNSGSQVIYWTAYISTNDTLEIGADQVFDSGSRTFLDGEDSSAPINISGYWTGTPGSYYIIIGLSASDDTLPGDNSSPSAAVYTIVDLPVLDPASLLINTGGAFSFSGSGGVPPYIYSLNSSGSGTPSIDGGTGNYIAGNSVGADTVRLTDDIGNTADCSISVVVSTSTVNYNTVIVSNTGGTAGGAPLSGSFVFTNNGTANGSDSVSWKVYTSLDNTIGAGDILIDDGTTSDLNFGVTSANIFFSGTWPIPVTDTTYYLIAQVSAPDDITVADNSGNTSALITAPVSSDIDYIIQSISNSPSSADVSTSVSQSFTFRNQGSDPGVLTVYWTAFISADQVLDGGDTVLNSGSESFLTALTTSGSINITGNWPASSGQYYLIIQASSGDDINPSNNFSASAPFTISATAIDIDYIVTNVTKHYPTVTSGSLISETFDLSNTGGLNGTAAIDWTAYASLDQSIGGDFLVASGTTPFSGLNAGTSFPFISINGNWPAVAGDYYLIVDVTSTDETITGNNTGFNGLYTVKNPPDYSISSTTIQSQGDPGTALSTYGTFDFTISEIAGVDGSLPVSWEVFVSDNNILDGGDVSIKEGNISALTASGDSGPISFDDALWPLSGSYYYIIISINSGDDDNATNNSYVSPTPLFVPELFTEAGETNSNFGPTAVPLSLVSDVDSTLQSNELNLLELVKIDGIMDLKFEWDTFKITTGPSITELDIYATWSTTFDELDLYLWDESSNQWISNDWLPDGEPVSNPTTPPASFTVSPNTTYYIGAYFLRNGGAGFPYSIIVNGR